jgi:hypothetical protein
MEAMSLIPSESASFPDLVGQQHGYLPPNLRRPSARRRQQPTADPIAPPPAKCAKANGAALHSETEMAPLEALTPLENQVGPREDAPVCNQTIEQVVISASAPETLELIEPLEVLTLVEDQVRPGEDAPVCNQTVEQLLLPISAPAGAEALEPLDSTNNKPVEGEARERLNPSKDAPADTSRSPRVALPIPPQRSPAQMRAKIQAQDVAAPTPTRRPRTPVRGLAIAQPAVTVSEKPPSKWSSCFGVLNLPRHRLLKLLRFVMCEVIAVGVLMLAMGFGFSHQIENNLLSLLLKILAIAAAVAAIAVPVIFYGLPDEVSRSDR